MNDFLGDSDDLLLVLNELSSIAIFAFIVLVFSFTLYYLLKFLSKKDETEKHEVLNQSKIIKAFIVMNKREAVNHSKDREMYRITLGSISQRNEEDRKLYRNSLKTIEKSFTQHEINAERRHQEIKDVLIIETEKILTTILGETRSG